MSVKTQYLFTYLAPRWAHPNARIRLEHQQKVLNFKADSHSQAFKRAGDVIAATLMQLPGAGCIGVPVNLTYQDNRTGKWHSLSCDNVLPAYRYAGLIPLPKSEKNLEQFMTEMRTTWAKGANESV